MRDSRRRARDAAEARCARAGPGVASGAAMASVRISPPRAVFPHALAPRGLHLLDAASFCAPGTALHRVLANKRRAFANFGWCHTVMAPGGGHPLPEGRGHAQIDCGGLPLPRGAGLRFAWRHDAAVAAIERAEPDVVEAADPFVLGRAALRAAARLGVPAVAAVHGDAAMGLAQALGAGGTTAVA